MPRHWETTRLFFLSAPRSAFAASRWCSLPAGCFPCRRLLRFPLSAVFHGAPANPHRCPQPVTASRCCRILFHAGSPAERQLFRTDFRFAPSPRSASLAGPPIHEGHGRPRSVRKSSRLRWKGLSARLYLSTGLLLLRQTQICRPICTDCLRHLRISAG